MKTGLRIAAICLWMLAITQAEESDSKLKRATFGGGCFWCTEGVFEKLDAVKDARSGYAGGKIDNPTYKQICRGDTGHAEVVELKYDPAKITYDELLNFFWKSHDPTTLNRQGNDVGTQYRSVIFYHNDEQKAAAEASKKKLDASGTYTSPIVTEISPAPKFFVAEEYHQDFQKKNPRHPYLQNILDPKLEKLEESLKAHNEKSSK